MKHLILLLFPAIVFSQELHHEMISSQGKNVELESGIYVTQSIGQQSVTGSMSDSSNKIIQGYQQAYWNRLISTSTSPSIDISYYPNPIVDIVNFNFTNLPNDELGVMVFDFAGRNVMNRKIDISNYKSTLDMSGLPSGSYLIYLHNNKINFYTKIIKK
tara:strand:+ start:11 stop:487 length:477 start_codon:yes stop_codon:yes gene_type:complete